MTGITPWTYNFKYNYYQNFYINRRTAMSNSGSFYDMYVKDWKPYDEVKSIGGVSVNNGVEIAPYVKRHYNGDMVFTSTENPHHYARVDFVSSNGAMYFNYVMESGGGATITVSIEEWAQV